jgi:glucose-1-phosphate thymidylyltransferase
MIIMSKLSLNVLLLAAGFGTRLKEIGKKTAKGLLKNSQGLSITDLMINQVSQIEQLYRLALVANQKFHQQYKNHIKTNYPKLNIEVLNDGVTQPAERLGSLGDLVFALNKLEWWNEPVLVLPSDRTPENIIPELIKTYLQHSDSFVTCLAKDKKENIKHKSGCAIINDQNQIIDFEEKPAKPKSNYRGLPFYIFSPATLELLKKYQDTGHNMDSPGNIIPWLLENNFPVYSCLTNEDSFDIGDLTELADFRQSHAV